MKELNNEPLPTANPKVTSMFSGLQFKCQSIVEEEADSQIQQLNSKSL